MFNVPGAVYVLWIIGLVVVGLVLPVVVMLLHRLWWDARHIERYSAEALAAGLGIAGNTQHITALRGTIEIATGILSTAQAIDQHTAAIQQLLAGRSGKRWEPD
jgi:hypothetical protein